MKGQRILTSALVLGLLLVLAVGLSQAQGPGPDGGVQPQEEASIAANVRSRFSYQGVLKENGSPVTGSRDMTFRLYSDDTCSTQVDDIPKPGVQVTDGLFSVELGVTHSDFDGQGLWLEVEVGGTQIGCQEILPVPYALSLRPGATIEDAASYMKLNHYLLTSVSPTTFRKYGVYAKAEGTTGNYTYYGVYGHGSDCGVHGDSDNGTGVYGSSDSGAAIRASGTGIIQSTAKSYLWISGNGVRPVPPKRQHIIDMDTSGGAFIYRGATTGDKNVMLPITVVGPLYGQDVTISALDIYWKGDTEEFDVITAVILRRQTGVGSYANIVYDLSGGYTCGDSMHPEGCTIHYDTTSNNVLTADSGILYLTLGLQFSGAGSWIEIGGVRLTLEHY